MSSVYTLIPRPIGSFAGLDMAARYAFGLIFDRWQLSAKDGSGKYKDQYGVYCVYSRDALAAEMGISLPTLRAAMKQLIDREVIHSRIVTSGGPWRYYVPPRILDELRAERKPQQPQKQPDRKQGSKEPMLRYTPEERRKTYEAAVVDIFDD